MALDNGVKRQVVNLLKAVRLVMRSRLGSAPVLPRWGCGGGAPTLWTRGGEGSSSAFLSRRCRPSRGGGGPPGGPAAACAVGAPRGVLQTPPCATRAASALGTNAPVLFGASRPVWPPLCGYGLPPPPPPVSTGPRGGCRHSPAGGCQHAGHHWAAAAGLSAGAQRGINLRRGLAAGAAATEKRVQKTGRGPARLSPPLTHTLLPSTHRQSGRAPRRRCHCRCRCRRCRCR